MTQLAGNLGSGAGTVGQLEGLLGRRKWREVRARDMSLRSFTLKNQKR